MNLKNVYSVSRIRTYNTCPRQHEYRYVKGLVPKEQDESLKRGIELHAKLANIYLNRGDDSPLTDWILQSDDLVPSKYVEYPVAKEQGFGGVLDLIAQNKTSGKTWVVDHKSVENFYAYPDLYAMQQVGMYVNNSPVQGVAGGCLNRIMYKPAVTYQHAFSYALRYLKSKQNIGLTKGKVKKWEKELIGVRPKGRAPKGVYRYYKHILRPRSLKITRYDNDGQIVTALTYLGDAKSGPLLHIERSYIPLDRISLQAIRKDFNATVHRIKDGGFYAKVRQPGLHCARCPFQVLCAEELLRGEQPNAWIKELEEYKEKAYRAGKPNEEIINAMKDWSEG